MSPSLRGSGLKWCRCLNAGSYTVVSLFTREWIEMTKFDKIAVYRKSLPLYEGVDWNFFFRRLPLAGGLSPSLRGSGLKSLCPDKYETITVVSLFTREWIEIRQFYHNLTENTSLPLYEGVDWNCSAYCLTSDKVVSLFTREWIEIKGEIKLENLKNRLPLYEGVDWNYDVSHGIDSTVTSPSLRGSGLKCNLLPPEWLCNQSPSLRGSGLKFVDQLDCTLNKMSPSLRGSGLKSWRICRGHQEPTVSLFTREWIEILW